MPVAAPPSLPSPPPPLYYYLLKKTDAALFSDAAPRQALHNTSDRDARTDRSALFLPIAENDRSPSEIIGKAIQLNCSLDDTIQDAQTPNNAQLCSDNGNHKQKPVSEEERGTTTK
ncbi:Protein of unknown function [Gryllus bimaculatus]|nr:Protein of unknown function [Gryllus bimaculatus]